MNYQKEYRFQQTWPVYKFVFLLRIGFPWSHHMVQKWIPDSHGLLQDTKSDHSDSLEKWIFYHGSKIASKSFAKTVLQNFSFEIRHASSNKEKLNRWSNFSYSYLFSADTAGPKMLKRKFDNSIVFCHSSEISEGDWIWIRNELFQHFNYEFTTSET